MENNRCEHISLRDVSEYESYFVAYPVDHIPDRKKGCSL